MKGLFQMKDKRVNLKTARRKLGKLAVGMADDQVEELLDALYLLADENLSSNGSKESEISNDTTIPRNQA